MGLLHDLFYRKRWWEQQSTKRFLWEPRTNENGAPGSEFWIMCTRDEKESIPLYRVASNRYTERWGKVVGWLLARRGVVDCWPRVAEARSTEFPASSMINCWFHFWISEKASSMDCWRSSFMLGYPMVWRWRTKRCYPSAFNDGHVERTRIQYNDKFDKATLL